MKAEQAYLKKITLIFKIILLPITFGFVFYKLTYAYHLGDLLDQITFVWDKTTVLIILLSLLLTFINYALETAKWHLLIKKHEGQSYWQAFKGVFAGVALNIITPNQLGDFVGRVMFLKNFDKVRGTLITAISHTSQVISTIVLGVFSLIWLAPQKQMITQGTANILFWVFSGVTVATLIGYLNIRFFAKLKITKRFRTYLDVFELYSRADLMLLMIYSLTRYLIFTIQYLLFIQLFKVDVTLTQALACMMAAMFAQSFLPSFILVEIGIRGASALWFFSLFTNQVTPVLLSTYSVWIINLLLPGMFGLFFILQWRAKR